MSTKKVLVLTVVSSIVVVAVVGAIIFFYINNNLLADNQNMEKIHYPVGEVYANLKESRKILKCNIVIEVTDKKLVEEFDNKKFIITDEINKIIRNKTEKDTEGSQGQLALQNEIKNRLSKVFNTTNITNIYFQELIVQ